MQIVSSNTTTTRLSLSPTTFFRMPKLQVQQPPLLALSLSSRGTSYSLNFLLVALLEVLVLLLPKQLPSAVVSLPLPLLVGA